MKRSTESMLRDRRHVDRIIPPEHSQRMLELASHVHYFAIQVDGYRPRPQQSIYTGGTVQIMGCRSQSASAGVTRDGRN